MKQLYYGALLLAGLAGCAPTEDGLYRVMVSGKDHTWVEIESIWHFENPSRPTSEYRVWYVRPRGWRWWQPTHYDLLGEATPDLPMLYRLSGDTVAIHLLGYKGLHLQKYTFHGVWPAVQLHK